MGSDRHIASAYTEHTRRKNPKAYIHVSTRFRSHVLLRAAENGTRISAGGVWNSLLCCVINNPRLYEKLRSMQK
jgi:hypothetical protein